MGPPIKWHPFNATSILDWYKAAFDDARRGTFTPDAEDRCRTVECNGGRTERRTGTVLGGPSGRRQCSVRYYIASRPPDAEALLGLVRGHCGMENGLHRTLDVQFRKDDCRIRSKLPESREFGFASLWVYLNVASMSNDPLVELQLMSRSTSLLSARLPNSVMGAGNGTDVLSRPQVIMGSISPSLLIHCSRR